LVCFYKLEITPLPNFNRNCQAVRLESQGEEDVLRSGGEGLEDVETLLSGGGNDRSQARKFDSTLKGAKAAGDFHPQLHHSQVLFGEVVCEGHVEIVEEAERFGLVGLEADEQIMSWALLWLSLRFG
jgi:hypothetical protein